jgi:hypothetical protein
MVTQQGTDRGALLRNAGVLHVSHEAYIANMLENFA